MRTKAARVGRTDLLDRLRRDLTAAWGRKVGDRDALDAALLVACKGYDLHGSPADAEALRMEVSDRPGGRRAP